VELQPLLAALLGGSATGFLKLARKTVLAEQEWIRGALIRELRRVEEALRQEFALADALGKAAAAISSTLDLDQVLDRILEQVSRVVPSDAANIMLIEGNWARIARWRGYERFGAEESISTLVLHIPEIPGFQHIMKSGEPLVIPDIATYSGWVQVQEWLRSYAAAPIIVRGEIIGFLNVDSATPGFFDQAHAEALRAFADHAATAIENAQLYEAAQREIAERKRTEEELIHLSKAVEVSVDSIVIVDVEGKIMDVNEATLKMYGSDNKGDLIGQHCLDFIAPERREKGQDGIEFVLEKGYDMSQGYEAITRDGRRIPMELSAAVMKDADGKPIGIVIIARDITERKQAEEELRDKEATMRALLNAPIEAATLIDAHGIILGANEATAKSFGKSVDELVGLCVYSLFPPAVAEYRKAQVDKVFRLGYPVRFEDEREGRFFDHSLYPVFDAQGKVARIAAYVRDITHHKQAEARLLTYQQRLRSLASQLSLTEERERRRLATELHDCVGQTLALCKIKLGMVRQLASSTELAEALDEIDKYLKEIVRATRALTFEISSPILYQLGLEAALEWLTEQIWERHGISSKFSDDRQPKPLDDDIRVLLFQAVRELLVNVAKHAQAQSVKVAIRRDDSDVQIIVEDNGAGFANFPIGSHWSEIKGFGLFSIRERLDHVGGQLRIKSEPGNGTHVTLVAPLKRNEMATRQERK
jgi:PAS domain S-box-containing protein